MIPILHMPSLPSIPSSTRSTTVFQQDNNPLRIPEAQKSIEKTKQIYRVRESLPGAFVVEELDLTRDVGRKDVRIKKGKTFRKSEVCVLDLTGE
jgi:hypothetical protein